MIRTITILDRITRAKQDTVLHSFDIANLDRTLETQEHQFYTGTLKNGGAPEEVAIKVYKPPEAGVTEGDILGEYNAEIEAVQRLGSLELGPEFLGEITFNNRPALVTSNGYIRITDLSPEQVIKLFTGDNLPKVKEALLIKAKQITDAGFSISNIDLAVTNGSNPPEIIFINPFQTKDIRETERTKETSRISSKGMHLIENILRKAQGGSENIDTSNAERLRKFNLTGFRMQASHIKEMLLKDKVGDVEIKKKLGHGQAGIVFEGQMLDLHGRLKPVAVKVMNEILVETEGEWKKLIEDLIKEVEKSRVLEKTVNGPEIYGIVDTGGNPAFAMELIKGFHLDELSTEQVRALINKNTFTEAKRKLQQIVDEGYVINDPQFLIVTETDSKRNAGEVVFFDSHEMVEIQKDSRFTTELAKKLFGRKPTESESKESAFNYMWDLVSKELQTAQKRASDIT